ncbi:MAG: glycosyltransferase [Pirellula sp.]
MRAMIFEPQFLGHNLVYVRHIVGALEQLGTRVTLLTSRQVVDSEEFRKYLSDLKGSFEVLVSENFALSSDGTSVRVNGPQGLLSSLRAILTGLKSSNPDHFFLPFGNPLAHALGLPNPVSKYLRENRVEAEIVLLFGKYAYQHHDWVSRAKQELALRLLAHGPWTRIHHIVPHAIEVMQSHGSRIRNIAHLLPDPIDPPPTMTQSEARAMLGLNPAGKYVSLVGLIDERKGVGDLLRAAKLLGGRLGPETSVLLAGKHSEVARNLLASEFKELVISSRIVSIDRHLSQDELWAACIASDLITTPYPEHRYSASIVLRAAAVGVPVLANAIGWMEDVTHRYSLGWTCRTRDPREFALKMSEILAQPGAYTQTPQAKSFVEFHSLANFQSRITERIRQRQAAQLEAA